MRAWFWWVMNQFACDGCSRHRLSARDRGRYFGQWCSKCWKGK
jgi:hypothetical protein